MESKYRPCPFCGGTDIVLLNEEELYEVEGIEDMNFGIYCRGCSVSGGMGDTPSEATRKWNTRMNPKGVQVKQIGPKIYTIKE